MPLESFKIINLIIFLFLYCIQTMPTQENNVQQLPIANESSTISTVPPTVTNQPVALLVYPNADGENVPVSPEHVFVLPNCNLRVEVNSSTHAATGQNKPPLLMSSTTYTGGAKVPLPSLRGLECLNGVGKIWIYQKVELFQSK